MPGKKPLGPAPEFSDDELDKLAEVNASDVQAAIVFWDEGDNPLAGLLQATPEEDDSNSANSTKNGK